METTITQQEYSNENLQPKKRIWELDFLRGLCVLLMIYDHFMFDIYGIFGQAWYNYAADAGLASADMFDKLCIAADEYWSSPLRSFVEPLVVKIFCLLCGISCSFSRNNFKRGIEITICSVLIIIVTHLLGDDMAITFGIFQMFSIAILFWCLLDFICKHKKYTTAIVSGIIGLIIIIINAICMSKYNIDSNFFADNSNWFFIGEFMVGGNGNIPSADYQPIFPLVGYMLVGAALGPVIYKNKKSLLPNLGKYDWYEPINLWGRIAMWVYILHQIVIAGILAIISYLFITPGNLIII